MRKLLVLTVALLFVLSGAVMAEGHEYTGYFDNPFDLGIHDENGDISEEDWDFYYQGYYESQDDGIVFYNDASTDDKYVNLDDINRENVNLDGDGGKFGSNQEYQAVEVEMPAYAYIPCFLEIKVTGNLGTTSVASFGPQAEGTMATKSAEIYNITFDNEVGGFVDSDWNSLGYGQNVEFDLQEELDAFIRGCDVFAVEVMSNADYRYAVAGSALEGPGDATLDMYMRTHVGLDGDWEDTEAHFTGNTVEEEYAMEDIDAGTESLFVHDFKVPFDATSTHGEYSGAVYFRAATI